jgi:F-type H+-transporting ATPase subunit a
MLIIELAFEKAYDFFEEILWKEEKKWIKLYIVTMFFVIIISNLLWVFLDFLSPIFWKSMEHFIKIPTADINFNIAMAIVWVIIVILEQFKALGFWKAMGEYVPIFWKNLIPYEKWKIPPLLDNLVFWLVKIFDITISLFLWVLEVIWHFAKIISLSFRLFWNMTSGWILLGMLIAAASALSLSVIKIDFPVALPVILYLQGILVAFIQALVFPLLIAIFIKVAKVH